MAPSKNEASSKILSDNANKLNIKKIQVNAQVTALTSLLELLGNIIVVIIVVITKASTFAVVISVTIFYQILLPYVFLMNTSHNKARIIEYGWKNVFQNLTLNSKTVAKSNENTSNKSTSNGNNQSTENMERNSSNNNKLFVSATGYSAQASNNKNSSSILKHQNKEPNQRHPVNAVVSVIDLEQQNDQRRLAENIITGMVKNIDNEEKVMEQIKKLAVLNECSRKGEVLSHLELESEMLFNCK